jgi:hypothetical protein
MSGLAHPPFDVCGQLKAARCGKVFRAAAFPRPTIFLQAAHLTVQDFSGKGLILSFAAFAVIVPPSSIRSLTQRRKSRDN